MTQALPIANFNSSRLVRFLTDLAVTNTTPVPQHFAERLGRFLDFSDAITLAAVLDDAAKSSFKPHAASKDSIEEEFLQARNNMITAIAKSCTPNNEQARIRLPSIPLIGPFDPSAVFDRYHRFYATHQQNIDTQVRTLRANVRNAIAGVSPALKQLTVLDTAYEEILTDPTRKLLATLPRILEMRFDQLLKQHQQTQAQLRQTSLIQSSSTQNGDAKTQEPQDEDRSIWAQPGGWVAQFNQEIQGLLLAELDLRLQPALGLVEAFSKEVQKLP